MQSPHVREALETAIARATRDRHDLYGDCFANMSCFAEFCKVYTKYAGNRRHAAHDAAILGVLAKLARIACGSFHADNYIDLAAYSAIAFDCEARAAEAAGERAV